MGDVGEQWKRLKGDGMNQELKTILDNIISDLKEHGHDPLERPVCFMWSYPEEELRYTLVIQKDEGMEEDDNPPVDGQLEAVH